MAKRGADLFSLRDSTFLLVVDYYSRFVEIAQLSPTRSTDVVVHLKSMFARHGIPETFVSDNSPPFSGAAMKAFASDYGFGHVPSSSKFPHSNGVAERTVQIKNLLKKAQDPYHTLLAYRTTPLSNGYSPEQLAFAPHCPPFWRLCNQNSKIFKRSSARRRSKEKRGSLMQKQRGL